MIIIADIITEKLFTTVKLESYQKVLRFHIASMIYNQY